MIEDAAALRYGPAAVRSRNDLDEVIDVEPATSRTSDDSHAARSQSQDLTISRDSHFFLRFRSERNPDRVADSFVQQNAKTDGRLNSAAERRARFRHAEMKRIVDLEPATDTRRRSDARPKLSAR